MFSNLNRNKIFKTTRQEEGSCYKTYINILLGTLQAVLLSINLYDIDGIWNEFLSGTPRIEPGAAGCEAKTSFVLCGPPQCFSFARFIFNQAKISFCQNASAQVILGI